MRGISSRTCLLPSFYGPVNPVAPGLDYRRDLTRTMSVNQARQCLVTRHGCVPWPSHCGIVLGVRLGRVGFAVVAAIGRTGVIDAAHRQPVSSKQTTTTNAVEVIDPNPRMMGNGFLDRTCPQKQLLLILRLRKRSLNHAMRDLLINHH